MASYTTNLNLKKPAGSENVAIGDINNNMDTIDQAFGTLNSNLTNKTSKLIGEWNTPTTVAANTYATVKTIDIRNVSSSMKILYVRAIYYSGEPTGIRIGTSASYGSGTFVYIRTFEPSSYLELDGGTSVLLPSNVQEIEIQQKFSGSSGSGFGYYMLVY